ncbi:MAG: VTC domain-containing protein, partial [Lachnospiraceae bacterium]|nr:VTC domain-containing protein [Lachnospiraceae bacterium]
MTYQDTFKRYELKYLIDDKQKKALLKAMEGRMALDQYGRTTIMNVYYDTPDYLLIQRSLEKPTYKEKLRV